MTSDIPDEITTDIMANPILPGFNPDPSICRVDDDYYLVTSSFEFWPAVPIYHSRDLVEWTLIGHAINRRSQLILRGVPCSGGVWAPTIRYNSVRRTWYMITSVQWHGSAFREMSPRPFVIHSRNIWDDDSWSDPVYLDMLGIDPDLFFDDDGRVYVCAAQKSRPHRHAEGTARPWMTTFGCEVNVDTGLSVSQPVEIRRSHIGRGIAEGPHIFKRDGWYYLLTAEGGTEILHRGMVSRSRSPLGPYEEPDDGSGINPIVYNGEDPLVQRTGHVDMVQTPTGQWWAVLLGVRPCRGGISPLGRETFLAPVHWSSDGWPVVNNHLPISYCIPGKKRQRSTLKWKDTFCESILQLGWYTARTPNRDDFYTIGKGGLYLRGGGYTLDDVECSSLLLRRITRLDGVWTASLRFLPRTVSEEAGAVLYQSNESYAMLFIGRGANGPTIGYRWRGADGVLHIRPTPEAYHLSYSFNDKRLPSDRIDCLALPTKALHRDGPGVWSFTGLHFGIFAQNRDQTSNTGLARFDLVEYIPGV